MCVCVCDTPPPFVLEYQYETNKHSNNTVYLHFDKHNDGWVQCIL